MCEIANTPYNGFIPIGVLTRNRPAHLDLTLRSLAACLLPKEIQITIYDDASDSWMANKYLYTSERISKVPLCIPDSVMQYIPSIKTPVTLHGIHKQIEVVRMEHHLGVLHGSMRALCSLAEKSKSQYICLLQDDIVFVEDWYNTMCKMVTQYYPGVLAGITFGCAVSSSDIDQKYSAINKKFVQAQCLFVSRNFLFDFLLPASSKVDKLCKHGFDTFLCDIATNNGIDILVTYPNLCQHLGVKSLVRPERNFYRKGGRYSQSLKEKVVFSDKVRCLLKGVNQNG